jgi:hypothetical protein
MKQNTAHKSFGYIETGEQLKHRGNKANRDMLMFGGSIGALCIGLLANSIMADSPSKPEAKTICVQEDVPVSTGDSVWRLIKNNKFATSTSSTAELVDATTSLLNDRRQDLTAGNEVDLVVDIVNDANRCTTNGYIPIPLSPKK